VTWTKDCPSLPLFERKRVIIFVIGKLNKEYNLSFKMSGQHVFK